MTQLTWSACMCAHNNGTVPPTALPRRCSHGDASRWGCPEDGAARSARAGYHGANARRIAHMRVRFWGTRGSIATPGPGTNHFGGNTSCVELTTNAGDLLIFDCGTGARQLAGALMARGKGAIHASILLGHTHWDHIQGFPFFTPAFVKGNTIAIYGPAGSRNPLHDVLAGQMEFTYFPI